jgi:bisphosphoglycerate-dependent phosphoglycerate mutase family 1
MLLCVWPSLALRLSLQGGTVSTLLACSKVTAPCRCGRIQAAQQKPGHLVLVRHGETEWPSNTFIGWADPDLSEEGARQAQEVALALKESGYSFDVAYSSVLKRAVHTTWLLLKALDLVHLPIWKTWRLSERSYGALTGRTIEGASKRYGEATVSSWRRSFTERPPEYGADHPLHPGVTRGIRTTLETPGALARARSRLLDF